MDRENRINLSYRRYLNDDLEKQVGTERTEVIFSIYPPHKIGETNQNKNYSQDITQR